MESQGITIQVKASVSTFSSYCLLCCSMWFQLLSLCVAMATQTKAIALYFPVV